MIDNQKNANKRINIFMGVTIFAGLLLIGLLLYFVYRNKGGNGDSILPQDEEYIYKIENINQKFEINDSAYVQVLNINTFEYDDSNSDYITARINITFNNMKEMGTKTSYHLYQLLDVEGNKVSNCYSDTAILDGDRYVDLLTVDIDPSSTASGYIYCDSYSGDIVKYFQIRVIVSGSLDDDGNVSYEYKDYVVDLK